MLGRCPNCREKIPFHFKEKVVCPSCKSKLQYDQKTGGILCFSIFIIYYLLRQLDWKIALSVTIPIAVVGLMNMKYRIISLGEENK